MAYFNNIFCNCEFDPQIAYISNNINKKPIETIAITISEYDDDINLHNLINNNIKFLICSNNNILIKYNLDKNYFKHKDFKDHKIPIWYKTWLNYFHETETEIRIGNRRVDAIVNNIILEFQYNLISYINVQKRMQNYLLFDKILYWIIDCNNSVSIETNDNITFLLTFKTNTWKYKNFCNIDKLNYIYLNIDDKLFKINPNNVINYCIKVKEYKLVTDFIDSIYQNNLVWINNNNDSDLIDKHGIIYHTQSGAGSGKTYKSIQLIQNDDRFKDKDIFIYLTKLHSAKDVILNELISQYDRGDLPSLEEIFKSIECKQYKIIYRNNNINKNIQIIIGTIDSFTYAIGNSDKDEKDYFKSIVKSIRNGHVMVNDNGKIQHDCTIKYSGNSIKLNNKCLIIIDEAQDLGAEYIEAFDQIIKKTGIDLYIIGDKLQSIWGNNNLHTFLENNNLGYILKQTDQNNVMRFHNRQFIDFVNNIIKFTEYNLAPINSICNLQNCKYKHEDDQIPYTIFEIPVIVKKNQFSQYDNIIEKIINYIEYQIQTYNYLPNNFMFIFSILKNNYLANTLESRLQDFWIQKFADDNYQTNVLKYNDHWKDKINDNLFHKYVYLHKYEVGNSINIKESEYASRILSIHSSKGIGCDVVFLFGLSEDFLKIFSKEDNLAYESLLHVALTRQKKHIYIALEKKNDDIKRRFDGYVIEKNENIEPNLYFIWKSNKFCKIIYY